MDFMKKISLKKIIFLKIQKIIKKIKFMKKMINGI